MIQKALWATLKTTKLFYYVLNASQALISLFLTKTVRQILLSLTIVREGELIWKVADWGSNPGLRYWATTTRLFCQFRERRAGADLFEQRL